MDAVSLKIDPDVAAIAQIDAVPTMLNLICQVTGMGFAAVARVTDEQWIACSVKDEIGFGLLPGGELELQTTICHEVRQCRQPVIIDHVAEDETWRDHHTPARYGFQSYISMPIVLADGSFFGTLCAIDPDPATLRTPEVTAMFALFAQLIAFHLDSMAKVEQSQAALLDERATATLREQFIAVLGHDLRNPLAGIDGGVRLLERETLSERGLGVLALMRQSVNRMSGLIDDVLDLARGRLGGGLSLGHRRSELLGPLLDQVVAELRSAYPGRSIETRYDLAAAVPCDRSRLAQLFSNLIANALTHGAADAPVVIAAETSDREFRFSVANAGEPIPPDVIERLFEPFYRGDARKGQRGLGLGLYIAWEIARAHGGTLEVKSTSEETRFTLRVPLG
jgi:signal transduction histidine kinase